MGIRSPLEEGGCGGQLREACSFVLVWSDEEVSCCTDEIHPCSATDKLLRLFKNYVITMKEL